MSSGPASSDPSMAYCRLNDSIVVYRSDTLAAACETQNIPSDLARRCNTFTNPLGPMAGVGHVLLTRRDFGKLDIEGEHTLTFFGDTLGDPVKIYRLHIVEARSAVRVGIKDDPGAMMIVRLADRRDWLETSTWCLPSDKVYNIRQTPDAGGEASKRYYDETTNSGTPWTWEEMIQDLWELMPQLGSWSGLPDTPHGTPESFVFKGSAYAALNSVLARCGFALRCLPYQSGGDFFDIVNLGDADAAFTTLLTANKDRLRIPDDPNEPVGRRAPASVTVMFRTFTPRGVELTLNDDSDQWLASRDVHSVEVQAADCNVPSTQVGKVLAGASANIMDDMGADIAYDGTIGNTSALTDRAADRGTQFYKNSLTPTWHRFHRGLVAFKPDGVCRYVRFSLDEDGLWTETGAGPFLPMTDGLGGMTEDRTANLKFPDAGGQDVPVYPDVVSHVLLDGTSGSPLTPTADGNYPGKWQSYNQVTKTWNDVRDAWWIPATALNGSTPAGGSRHLSRMNGPVTDGGVTKLLGIGTDLNASIVPGVVGSASTTGIDTKWTYAALLDNGLSISGAFNGCEAPNVASDGTTVQGNGIIAGDNGVTTITFRPIKSGVKTLFWSKIVGGVTQWWFDESNGYSETCD